MAYWRGIKNRSLRWLARESELHVSSIHRMEHGQQEPSASEVECIAAALQLSMAEFYGEVDRRRLPRKKRRAA